MTETLLSRWISVIHQNVIFKSYGNPKNKSANDRMSFSLSRHRAATVRFHSFYMAYSSQLESICTDL